jgi:fumarate reductase subunit D
VVALVLVIGVLLALPLGYLLDSQVREQHVEAVIAIVELSVMVVLVVAIRASRRSL